MRGGIVRLRSSVAYGADHDYDVAALRSENGTARSIEVKMI
jgi:hypothetical protein